MTRSNFVKRTAFNGSGAAVKVFRGCGSQTGAIATEGQSPLFLTKEGGEGWGEEVFNHLKHQSGGRARSIKKSKSPLSGSRPVRSSRGESDHQLQSHRSQIRAPGTFTLLLALALAWFSVSCSKSENADAAGKAGADRAVPVIVAKSTQRNVPVEIQAVGNVEPFSLVTVRPQITGRIQDVHFEEGQNVKAGDPLITLDPGPWLAELNQAQANLKRDEAQLFNARLEFQRSSNLFNSQIASEQDYQSAEADFRSAESTVLADAAAVTNAMVNLSYTQIVAPIDGRTGQIEVKAGNVVKSPDDALVTITQIRPAYVAFAVPEQYLSAIRHRASEAELPVRAFAPGEQDEAAEGKLTFIDNRVNTDTGTILLKATFANTNLVLWPASSCKQFSL